jgi:GAF domain-containing protein
VFAAFLLLKRWTNVLAVFLALYILAVGVWVGSNALADLAKTPFQNILWSGMAVIGGSFFMSFYLCFVYVFSHRRTPPLLNIIVFFLPTLIFSVTAFSKLSIAETLFPPGQPSQIVPGPLYPFLLVFIFGGLLYGSILLSLYYRRHATPQEQTQIQYMEGGFLTTFCACSLFNVILPIFGEYRFYSLGPQFAAVMIAASSYAILKHKLLDIKMVIQRGLVYMMVISLIAICYSAVVSLILTFTAGLTNQAYLIAVIVTTCLGILCFEPLKKFFIRLTDGTFYRNRLTHDMAVDAFSHALNESHGHGQLLYSITTTTRDVFRAEAVAFITLNKPVPCAADTRAMTLEECHQLTDECPIKLSSPTDLIIPLIMENRVTALLVLGNKKSGEPYYSDDLAMLTAFSYQAALALDQSCRYQQAIDRAMRLQDQHLHDEETLTIARQQAQKGLTNVHQALETIVSLKNQALTAPQTPAGNFVDDLSKLENSVLLANQMADNLKQSAIVPSFNLSALTTHLTEHFSHLAERQDAVLRQDIEPNLIVCGISQLIEDTLVATLGSALRYSCDNHEIIITLKKEGERAELGVRNNGCGMLANELPPYFDQLRRTTGFGSELGTGLTLSMTPQETRLNDEVLLVRTANDQVIEVCFTFKLAQ